MRYTICLFLLLGMPVVFIITQLHCTPLAYSYDYSSTEDNVLQEFCVPLIFKKNNISSFLTNCFNHPLYGQEYLPHSFSHFIQFLEYAQATEQQAIFYESIFRLFLNKIKSCPYVSCYALNEFCTQLPKLLQHAQGHLSVLNPVVQENFKNALYDIMIANFDLFKQDSEKFVDKASLSLLGIAQQPWAKEHFVNNEQLRQIIIRFLEIVLLKIVWPVQDALSTWDNLNGISLNLSQLMNQGIITKDELDDLYHSLIESYCRFIRLYTDELPQSMLEKIQHMVSNGTSLIVLIEEQEQGLLTKKDYVLRTVTQALSRKLAQAKGIVPASKR